MKITVVNSPHVSTDRIRQVILECGGTVTYPLLKCMDDDGVFKGKTDGDQQLNAVGTLIAPKGGSVSVSRKANDSFIINANIVIGNRKISDVSNIKTIPVTGGNVAVDNEIKSMTDIDKTLRPALQRKIDALNETIAIPIQGASVEASKKISKNLVKKISKNLV